MQPSQAVVNANLNFCIAFPTAGSCRCVQAVQKVVKKREFLPAGGELGAQVGNLLLVSASRALPL